MKKHPGTIMKLVVVGLLLFVIARQIQHGGVVFRHKPDPENLAQFVRDTCAHEAYPPSCYDREIPKLMDTQNISMEDAFEVTRVIQQSDSRYLYCHVLGHNVASKEVSRNPSKWKEVVTRCPTTMCNNGCPHGALMERFNAEYLTEDQINTIIPEIAGVCEPRSNWNPQEIERSMCYHAIGHLLMYLTGADVTKSSEYCKEIGSKQDGRNYVQTCTEGTVMSVFQPLEAEDVALVAGIAPKTADDAVRFCRSFTGMVYDACMRESWPLSLDEIRKPEGLVKFCGYTKDSAARRICYGTAMNILTIYLVVNTQGDLSDLVRFCDSVTSDMQDDCYQLTAMRLIQIDPEYTDIAIAVCGEATTRGLGDSCYKGLQYYASQSFHSGSGELQTYCSKFPENYKTSCLTREVTELYF